MNPSLPLLRRWSDDTGYRPEVLERVARLGALAADLFRHPALREALVLKGGTALNLGFGPPSRLSVDLDFNYVGHTDREAMLGARPLLEVAGNRPVAKDWVAGAWTVVGPLVQWEGPEREYVDRLAAGDVQTGLLFPGDADAAARIAAHPALLWKASHAAGHAAREKGREETEP